tara:strand:+ start:99648 stop:99929 length:282 start_codon:yes stop_codon:yes gene_type:complete
MMRESEGHQMWVRKILMATLLVSAGCAAKKEQSSSVTSEVRAEGKSAGVTAEIWVDNWFALYVNGEKVLEDSVAITTERSFNAETFTITAPCQ